MSIFFRILAKNKIIQELELFRRIIQHTAEREDLK